MEKLVVFPLNNDEVTSELKRKQIISGGCGISLWIGWLELLQKKSSIYCSTEFEDILLELMLLFFQKIQWDIVMTDTKKVQMALDSGKKFMLV